MIVVMLSLFVLIWLISLIDSFGIMCVWYVGCW